MSYHFKNLVFEGGGVKGIAYVGAMEELYGRGILQGIDRVAGASAGAINSVLIGLNYSAEEAREVLWECDFRNFMDSRWGILGGIMRVGNKYGWYKGDFFLNWIGNIIKKKTGDSGVTFSDIRRQKLSKGFKDIFVIGTNLSTHFSEVYSYEKTPELPLAEAVRISMAIPLFFASRRSRRGDCLVDGGVLANYPVKIFDREKYAITNKRNTDYYDEHNKKLLDQGLEISKYVYNKETLGFRLSSKEEIGIFRDQKEPVHHKIDNLIFYATGLVRTMIDHQLNIHLHSDDWQRTIYIEASAAKTTEFDLSDKKKEELIMAGKEGVRRYFEWFDNNPSINK